MVQIYSLLHPILTIYTSVVLSSKRILLLLRGWFMQSVLVCPNGYVQIHLYKLLSKKVVTLIQLDTTLIYTHTRCKLRVRGVLVGILKLSSHYTKYCI